jgi:SOS-response transcriptional repressor LexA
MKEDRPAIRQLILDALARRGWKPADLARASGVHHPTLSKIMNMRVQASSESCEKLASWLGVSVTELLTLAGRAPAHATTPPTRDELLERLLAVDATEVPMFDITGSASPSRLFLGDTPSEYAYLPERRRYARGRVKGLTIRGSCLSPLVQDGDQVFIDTQADWEDGDIVLAVVDDALHLKQLQSSPSGWVLAPKNGETALIVDEAVVVLGKYIGLWRPGLR